LSDAELVIDSIAAGGDGVARSNGVVVFVPRTAPGDRVRVSLDARKRFARGTLTDLLVPSKDRIEPLCYHYRVDRCGGCQLQHMRYDAQVEAKRAIIRDSLSRIGKRAVDPPEIVNSPQQWRYRRKLTLAMRRRTGSRDDWVIGLHPLDDPVGVFQLADCPITDERVVNIWRDVMEARGLFPDADELRASVRLLDDGAAIVMEGGNAWPERSAFFARVESASALWWRPAHRPRMLVAERYRDERRGRGAVASASFAQVNPDVARLLHDYVVDRVRSRRPRTVIDAYAGAGATAVPIAEQGATVVAIESDADAAARCGSLLPPGSRAIADRVEDVLGEVLPADVVIVNPPRVGLHERVSALLDAASPAPAALVYVSCDPATLGRDLARLPRYRIESLRAFDMFPQTAHVETVCELVPIDA
jgi:23S rRNA (uracil1939-C5)-methyltransferase